MEAQGSCLTNKYAEGYPGKRWYGGCENVDVVEQLAIDRAKQLFGCEHVNVQPHSGAQANMAVYFAVLKPGDKILAMNLAHGGHLTHGHPANFSGKFYQVSQYGVSAGDRADRLRRLAEASRGSPPDDDHRRRSAYPRIIDFPRHAPDRRFASARSSSSTWRTSPGSSPAAQHPSPMPHAQFRHHHHAQEPARPARRHRACARQQFAKADRRHGLPRRPGRPAHARHRRQGGLLPRSAPAQFKDYQQQVVINAKALAAGLAKHGYRIVSGGTDNHLMLVDLRPKGINGKIAQEVLDHAGITVNKNGIPFDTEPILNPAASASAPPPSPPAA